MPNRTRPGCFLAFPCPQWVGACRASLKRMGKERIALAQLHWSTANYAPLQARHAMLTSTWGRPRLMAVKAGTHGMRGAGLCTQP